MSSQGNWELVSNRERGRSVARESALLVGVLLGEKKSGESDTPPLEELDGLAEAAGVEVLGYLTQRRLKPDKTTYLGKGKVEQLQEMIEATDANLVIFDNDLAPGQTRNLEAVLDVKVLDRTELILDIFASRAQSHQARLAVELAQLEYAMPRLKRMWTHLSRQGVGGVGVGLRGPGETQLEVDRRLAQKKVTDLKKQLNAIRERKQREVAARQDTMTVSLIGYTNAGKSTLLNALTSSDVFVKDQLFATLDTRTKRWHLPGWGPVLLSDTVGFIRDLPHHLVEGFRATLEEACQADLLIHVADGSNPAVADQVSSAYQVLKELGIEEKNTVLVVNKVDSLKNGHEIERLMSRYPDAVPISAQTGEGLDRLSTAVSDALSRDFLNVEVEMAISNGRLMAYIADKGEVLSETYEEDRAVIRCRLPRRHLGRVEKEKDVRVSPIS